MTAKRIVISALGVAIVASAAWILHGILRTVTVAQIADAIHHTSVERVLASIVATAASFAGLAYYDRFATQMIAPGVVAGRHAWWVGAVSHALSNTLGFHAVTGGALRYRFYRQDGVSVGDIARITMVIGGCVVLGSLTMLVLALLIAPSVFAWGKLAGVIGSIALVGGWCALPAIARRLRRSRSNVPPLSRRALFVPVLVGLAEASAAMFALYVLLPADLAPDPVLFAAIVLGAAVLGLISHAPGGVGVFEATVLSAFPTDRHADVLAALLLYRLIYNLLPYSIAMIAVGWHATQPSLASIRRRV